MSSGRSSRSRSRSPSPRSTTDSRISVSNKEKSIDQRLRDAIRHDDLPTLETLVAGLPPGQIDASEDEDCPGEILLHTACRYGHLRIVRFLVEQGASLTCTDIKRRTPLHEAARSGKYEIVEFLLQAIEDPEARAQLVNFVDERLCTALHRAVRTDRCDQRIVKAFMEAGADPDLKDINGYTAGHHVCTELGAVDLEALDIMKILYRPGCAWVNQPLPPGYPQMGRTCLHIAAAKGFSHMIKWLVEIMEPEAIALEDDFDQYTAWEIAFQNRDHKVKFSAMSAFFDLPCLGPRSVCCPLGWYSIDSKCFVLSLKSVCFPSRSIAKL